MFIGKRYTAFCLFFTAILFFNCGSDNKQDDELVISGRENWNRSNTSIAKNNRDIINFGVTPIRSRKKLREMLRPLLQYLSEKTGKQFVLNIASDYDTLGRNLVEKKIDIASFSPVAYARALLKMGNGMKYIASVVKEMKGVNKAFYYGYIVVRKNSAISNIRDLHRKSFAFVDRASSSGYVYPQTLFRQLGIDGRTYFSNVFFLGQHDRVTDAIASGKIDGGATWDGNYKDALEKHGKIFRIIARTPPIPLDAWAANRSVSDVFIRKLQQTLVPINKKTTCRNGEKVINRKEYPYTGFVIRNNRFYDIVIKTVLQLRNSGGK